MFIAGRSVLSMFVERAYVTNILDMDWSSGFRYGVLFVSIAERWFMSYV